MHIYLKIEEQSSQISSQSSLKRQSLGLRRVSNMNKMNSDMGSVPFPKSCGVKNISTTHLIARRPHNAAVMH